MARHDPRVRHRNGAEPEVQLDGSVTLYGLEDWTQIRDDPLFEDDPSSTTDDERGE